MCLREREHVTTGERVAPDGSPANIVKQHLARYRFAQRFVRDHAVLDCACGTGYGMRLLRDAGARTVVGLDVDRSALASAKDQHGPVYPLVHGDMRRLPFRDAAFDVYVSFESIEHVADGRACVAEAYRVLKPGGLYVCSTPDRRQYDPGKAFGDPPSNPFHRVEYSLAEFRGLLGERFRDVTLYGQTFALLPTRGTRSIPRRLVSKEGLLAFVRLACAIAAGQVNPERRRSHVRPMRSERYERPVYLVAVCRKP